MTLFTETVSLSLADGSTVTCAAWWEPARNQQYGIGAGQFASALDVYVEAEINAADVTSATVEGVAHQVVATPGIYPPGIIIRRYAIISCAALLTDACTISRHDGDTMDPGTGAVTPTWVATWSGFCRIVAASPTSADFAGEPVSLSDPEVLLPLAAPIPAVGHRIQTADATLFVTGVITGTALALRRIRATTKTGADR
jgi:Family of unknown function (DUF6093)